MCSADYSPWDFDSPDRTYSHELDLKVHKNILAENARTLYGFD